VGHALAFASALFAADGQGGESMNVVHITSAQSPYAAAANQTIVVDASGGAVVINLPTLGLGQFVQVAQDSNTALTSTITVKPPAAGHIDQPPPVNGTFVTSFVFGPGTNWVTPSALGMDLTWYNGGSAGGYLLE
jgi:hypothetical protein